MIEEIPLSEIRKYAGYFSDPQLDMVIASMAEGNTRGQLWRSMPADNNIVCLLWDKGNNVFYLSGETLSKETAEDLAALIRTPIKKKAIAAGLSHFKIQALSASLEEEVPPLFQNIQPHKLPKLFYSFPGQKAPALAAPELENVKYALIDANFLEQASYQNVKYVKSEVEWMWSSPEKFKAHGFGYAALFEESIVCWCTAEYVSEKKCGIGIETMRDYQNKGLATATATHFVDYCLSHNITPHWECDGRNMGSIRVAEKVGFELIQETMSWAGEFVS